MKLYLLYQLKQINRNPTVLIKKTSKFLFFFPAILVLLPVLLIRPIVDKTLKAFNPMVIDYAYNGLRTEFMDIYLSSFWSIFLNSYKEIRMLSIIMVKLK